NAPFEELHLQALREHHATTHLEPVAEPAQHEQLPVGEEAGITGSHCRVLQPGAAGGARFADVLGGDGGAAHHDLADDTVRDGYAGVVNDAHVHALKGATTADDLPTGAGNGWLGRLTVDSAGRPRRPPLAEGKTGDREGRLRAAVRRTKRTPGEAVRPEQLLDTLQYPRIDALGTEDERPQRVEPQPRPV